MESTELNIIVFLQLSMNKQPMYGTEDVPRAFCE
jgi:hypothetical protein